MTEKDPTKPPPRAFTQGLGLVFQFVGVILFVAMMSVCCGSSLLSKDWATKTNLTKIGWHFHNDPADAPTYSAQKALTISLFTGVFLGMALAGIGLGLQAEHRSAVLLAPWVTTLGGTFWSVQGLFAVQMGFIVFGFIAVGLALVFAFLMEFALMAWKEVRRNPPPRGHELLPKDYKVPYSHYHEDPPEVRLARELEQRRARMEVEQKQMQILEERLKRRIEEQGGKADKSES